MELMMKTKLVAPILLMASLAAYGNNAMSSDTFAGALVGSGTGAVLGQVIGGRDGAIIGGFLGAMIGVAAADNDDHARVARAPAHFLPAPPPVMDYETPRVSYVQPIVVATNPPQNWRNEPYARYDSRRGHDREGWHDDHRPGDRWDRHGW
jgi:hypothetical protein